MAVPIRVLCIVPRGLAGRGGIETLFSHVDEQLRARPDIGIEMEFLASRGDASGAGWVLHFPIALARYAWLLATRRYDVVHLNTATNASAWRKWSMQLLARIAGVATVIHFHGSAFPKPGDRRPGWVPVLRQVFERAGAIVVLGDYWRDFVARFYGMPPERFDVVANGVADFAPDAPQAREEGAAVQLLFAGNLTDAKGASVLLRALALLPEHLPRWRAVLAGTGDVAGFRERAAQSGLSGQVEFTGWVARDAILPLYRQADIVVLPSRNEVLPVCLLEGACAGAALVATPVGSVPDVLSEGQNGLMITTDDPESAARALAQLIADASQREEFRAASRDVYVSRFRLETMIEALREVYRKALSANR
ncbi:glycosyltransferase family 4 protein [Pseudaminobacter soli (ex Li et al. 2025)]|uniref:glycosyltransferase family 4 protein n=1 Tax=Pseudaminobacter soli (ex Li et al. 2025) TaxID=1295366 RepID=UPI0015E7C6FB|nr:glycosyltransferase family 4 protein [Mesorhizobium soli]